MNRTSRNRNLPGEKLLKGENENQRDKRKTWRDDGRSGPQCQILINKDDSVLAVLVILKRAYSIE